MDIKSIKAKHMEHKKIMKVVKERDFERLNKQLKGIKGVAETLETDINNGVHDDEKKIAQRRKKFGWNAYKKPPPEGFLRSVWRPLQEFAILNDLVNILAAIILFVAASAVGSYIPSSHRKSKVTMNDDKIEVLRGGRRMKISIPEIVVGDVVCLKVGDKVPADGLFLKGQNLQVEVDDGDQSAVQVTETNPFLFSGSQVVDGYGGCQMMVTSVGMKSKWCQTMRQHSHHRKSEKGIATVEHRVNELIRLIRKRLALPIALIGFVVVMVRYFTGTTKGIDGNPEFSDGHMHGGGFFDSSVLKFVAAAFATIVVAIPESLRLCLPLTIYYSKKRMMADMEMVSDLSGWETMPFVTTICTDKTGTLSMNQMKVEKFLVGKDSFGEEANYLSNASDSFKKLLEEGIALNTTSPINTTPTDKAIISWAVHDLDMNMEVKTGCTALQYAAFDSQRKRSGVLMKREGDNTVCVHWKGEAEVILEMCSSYYDISGNIKDLVEAEKVEFKRIIQGMKESNLHCIAFAHNNIVNGDDPASANEPTLKEDGLVLLAIVGVKDPCGPEMNEAVKDCWKAKVDVKMFTGDDVSEATGIARQCGILGSERDINTAVIKGEQFRSYSQGERMNKVGNMEVMANSSPDDKLLMVNTLKKQGHIVAVCGNTTNGDALAMIEADVGISMGIRQGTGTGTDDVHVSSEKISDMVILDGNFATVPKFVRSSIGIYNNIQRFIQFQLTLNLATLAVFFISAVSAGEIPLNTTHVLWLNLVINTLASLALAMDHKPTAEELNRFRRPLKGRKQKVPLISNIMWRNILGQVVYQIAVVLVLLFEAESIFGVQDIAVRNSLIFNAFMLCQVFNEFNARSLVGIKSMFKGIHRDIPFLLLVAITICVQIMFGEFFLYHDSDYFVRLGWWHWCLCFGFSGISWPVDWGVKYIPVSEKPRMDEEARFSYIVEIGNR